jgi:Bacterial SH3 domain
VALLVLLTGCGGRPEPAAAPPPVPIPDPAPVSVLAETVTVVRSDPALERDLADARLQLLEQQAQIRNLQELLDEARREVVRSLAKLQTSASRAEAASAMAEAELAVQSLRRAGGAGADIQRAEQLMTESSAEFNRMNYGGALYLANQVKVVAAPRSAGAGEQRRPGETLFAVPVPLQASARANVREGPGTGFRVVFTLEKGAVLTGQSHVGGWIRVVDDDGRAGWIRQELVGER